MVHQNEGIEGVFLRVAVQLGVLLRLGEMSGGSDQTDQGVPLSNAVPSEVSFIGPSRILWTRK